MAGREVESAGWTDDLFRLLLDTHEGLKPLEVTPEGCQLPKTLEATLLGLKEELAARLQAMAQLEERDVRPYRITSCK
jgi:hypothetical protein